MRNLSRAYRKLLRYGLTKQNLSRLRNKDFSVISSNCIGGVLLHDLNQRFDTPTINLFFMADDYLKFIKNLRHYIESEFEFYPSANDYPMARLDDIVLHLVHYGSFEEAKTKWVERCRRIHFDNLFFILADRDGCTERIIREFDSLPYENKAVISYKKRPGIQSNVEIPDSEENHMVKDVMKYRSKLSGKRWLDHWDYVAFLNGSIQPCHEQDTACVAADTAW